MTDQPLPCTGDLANVRACAEECDVWGGDLVLAYDRTGGELCAAEIHDPVLGVGVEAFRCEAVCQARPAPPGWGPIFLASTTPVALAVAAVAVLWRVGRRRG